MPLRARFGRAPRTPVFYDGDCGFCARSVHAIHAMDLLHRLDFKNFRERAVQQAYPTLDLARAERELLIQDLRGRWYGGFSAFRWMAWRLPATWCIAPWLYVPGIRWVGERIYQWVAAHRDLFRSGAGGKRLTCERNVP